MDLHQFSDRLSIIGNMLIYHKEAHALQKSYCSINEPFWFYPIHIYHGQRNIEVFRHTVYKEYIKSIIENPDTLFFVNLSNYPAVLFPNVLFVSRWYKPPFKNKNPFVDRKQYIELVTVTLDGSSETMNSISYKELTGKDPIFRENIDIVDRVKLESLAAWRVGYSIF